jgi:diguanylate cyclase (GGDEF)-like protein
MGVVQDAKQLLLFLADYVEHDESQRGRFIFSGQELSEKSGLDAPRLNDAVEVLAGERHVDIEKYLGTAPYNFGHVSLTTAGRAESERLRSIGGSEPNREKQQKFGILDAPSLLEPDLAACTGRFGPSVLYLDLDYFKILNTKHTERAIDKTMLPAVHRLLLECVASNGFAYAEGGDEFVVLLPNSSEAMAIAFADSLLSTIRATEFSIDGVAEMVTASIGVASSASHPVSTLADVANVAKAQAKTDGRNRVVLARSSP